MTEEMYNAELDLIYERIEGYEKLPEEERIERYREEVIAAESKVLHMLDSELRGKMSDISLSRRTWTRIYLDIRAYVLTLMFRMHCTDEELCLFEERNARLQQLSKDMYSETSIVAHHLMDHPLKLNLDDIEIEGKLSCQCDEEDVIALDDDDFYGSEFSRIIPLISYLEREMPVISCRPWNRTDEQMGLDDPMDDGESWATGLLRHPKLDHIKICYATHVLLMHCNYSVPDFLRMTSYGVDVDIRLQRYREETHNLPLSCGNNI